MKLLLPLILIAVGSAACQSTMHRTARLSVDDDALVNVPVSQREEVAKARTECNEVQDRVTIAEHDVEMAKERLALAKQTAHISEEEVEAADDRVKLAHDMSDSGRANAIKTAEENREAIRAHCRWADSQVVYHERRVDGLKARVDIEKLRVELANAKVELAKAKAVNALERTDVDAYDVGAFEAVVANRQMNVELAKIDAEAWDKKMKLCRGALDDQAKLVPASYRDNWRKVDDSEVKSEIK
jgi:hypothetical protein